MKRQEYVESNLTIKRINFKLSIVGLLGLTMLLFSCTSNKVEDIVDLSADDNHPSMSAEDYVLTYSDSTIIRFIMTTPEIKNYEGKGEDEEPFTEFPKGVKVQKLDENQEVVSQLTADYARHLEAENRWIAENNVVAINEKGDSLLTEELIWDEKKAIIFSEKHVKIISEEQVINGIGFESDQDMENWVIKKPTGQMYLEAEN